MRPAESGRVPSPAYRAALPWRCEPRPGNWQPLSERTHRRTYPKFSLYVKTIGTIRCMVTPLIKTLTSFSAASTSGHQLEDKFLTVLGTGIAVRYLMQDLSGRYWTHIASKSKPVGHTSSVSLINYSKARAFDYFQRCSSVSENNLNRSATQCSESKNAQVVVSFNQRVYLVA